MPPALDISIPHASTATPSDSKPYTQYHILLRLPLRTQELKKRYTDFENLHSALQSETSSPPPSPLPAKSWFRRTVNNDSLTEERRQGLETYIRAIIAAEDARWRSSSAWRAFLNLPSGTSTVNENGGLSKDRRLSSGGGISDPGQWLDVHRELKGQIHTARQQLKQREAASTAQNQHALSAEAKASLVRAAANIAQLEDGLRNMGGAGKGAGGGEWGAKKLGDGELRRRKDMLAANRKEVEGLEAVLRSLASSATKGKGSGQSAGGQAASASDGDKSALFSGASQGPKTSGRVLGGGPLKETERTRELDNQGVLQLQQQVMQEQEEDVLSLGKTVSKLKDMGILINEELTVQNEMLGLVDQDVERLQGKIDVGRARIKKIH